MEGKTFVLPVRVYFEDTDAGGIVYHSNYLNFAERARTEMMRQFGLDHNRLMDGGQGLAFAVRQVVVDFRRPARLDDLLDVSAALTHVGGASLEMRQSIRRVSDGVELVGLELRLACMSLRGKAVRIPAELRDALQSFLAKELD